VDKIAREDFADGTIPATLFANLSAAEERTLSAFDTRRRLPDPLPRAQSTWQGLVVQQLIQKIDGLKSRSAEPSLSGEDREKIQKQIIDLTIRVKDVQRPFDQA
jgi:hypothetical protein